MEISPKSMKDRRKVGFQVKPIDLSRRQCPRQNLRCPRFIISGCLNKTEQLIVLVKINFIKLEDEK